MDGVTALFTREQFANELEASGSALCTCDQWDSTPTNPKTNAVMAHHCDCVKTELRLLEVDYADSEVPVLRQDR